MKLTVRCISQVFMGCLLSIGVLAGDSTDSREQNPCGGYFFDSLGGCGLSDETKKENMVEIQDALDSLKNLHGYRFNYIDDKSKQIVLGVKAQEIRDEYPEAVGADDAGTLYVNYTMLIPVLLQSINELSNKVSALEAKVNRLEQTQ